MAATDWQGGAPSAQQSQLLIVSAMAIGAVAGYGVVHWYMQRQPDAGPAQPGLWAEIRFTVPVSMGMAQLAAVQTPLRCGFKTVVGLWSIVVRDLHGQLA